MTLPVVLFVDATAPKPYDPETLDKEGLGGTEATVIRVAEGLAATGLFYVAVEQHNRTETFERGAQYNLPEGVPNADYVISLRFPQLVPLMQKRFPNAKHYLWNHDLMSPDFASMLVPMKGFEAIAVSNFHKTQMTEVLKPQGYTGQFPIKVVYNPIPDDLNPDNTPFDKNKLMWTSSPHKGLDYALSIFDNLLSFNPDFRLFVANPGYLPNHDGKNRNVIPLGPLAHPEVIAHLRSSLCLFYPNPVFPETFGLVLAEADAVGTPVIAHAMGAASEVLSHPYETMDCRNPKTVIDRVMGWYNGDRPKVKGNSKFRLSTVIKSWLRLFNVGV
jgi:glycosyltransferase involved in cell wall biosynthesis